MKEEEYRVQRAMERQHINEAVKAGQGGQVS
jgi:hypothetical protein